MHALNRILLFITFLAPLLMIHGSLYAVQRDWQTLKNCRLVESSGNDGDSFHANHQGKEYIFRLYFADAPETSQQVPARVSEQAEHFGLSEDAVLKAGQKASDFTLRILKQPFDVLTFFEDAKGQSAMPRYYAVVRPTNPGNKDLAELLVEAGLARAKGIQIKIPGSPSLADFKRMEANAKQLKMGVYGGNKPPRADKPKSSREAFESKFSAATPSPAPDTEALVPEVDLGIADDIGAALAMPTLTTESKTTSINRSKPPTVTKSPESTENVIDINNASRIQLMKLPGIGEKTARAIIEARPFSSIEELQRVGNIGPTTFARLKGLVEVRN